MRIIQLLLCIWVSTCVLAQNETKDTGSFWDNWYIQAGLDMSLQNPYGYDFSNVFPNGKTFGIDVAAGKWFSPIFGIRAKLNWENGIPLFENHHANWLAPMNKPGVNMDKGGYIDLVGDVQLNIHNLFSAYNADRKWNSMIFGRAGAIYNFGATDGSPLLGIGLGNTYRVSDRWSVVLDVAYNMTSSAVVPQAYTGVGSGSNGFFDITLSAQMDLGKKKELRSKREDLGKKESSFSSNWFLQAGLDMTLQNPYGCNFANVFPNGKSYGINIAVGKWFTPEVAVRGKVNWENGLIENKYITWVPPVDDPRQNYEKHGYIVASADVLFNLHNIIGGYDESRKWTACIYPKAGFIDQFAIEATSPVVGLGVENDYKLNDKLSLYADVDYQVTTSEASTGVTGANSGSNGFFRLEVGVTCNLGRQ